MTDSEFKRAFPGTKTNLFYVQEGLGKLQASESLSSNVRTEAIEYTKELFQMARREVAAGNQIDTFRSLAQKLAKECERLDISEAIPNPNETKRHWEATAARHLQLGIAA